MVDQPEPASPLLERESELALLGTLLGQARAGRGAVVAIEGPAGIGKSGLLAVAAAIAGDHGFRRLRARGRELEAGMAFAVASQLLEPPVVAASASERRPLLAGPASAGAGALGLAAGAAPESEFAALHGLYWLCVNLARSGPVLLAVDDLQWVDRPSLAWLGYVARRVSELPVLLAVTVRQDDPAAREPAVTGVIADSGVHRLPLRPLGQQSIATLVRGQLGNGASAEFCRACSDLCCGNPLYLRELLAAARGRQLTGSEDDAIALREMAPRAVGASVLSRLARMRPEAIALTEALAVLGSQTEVADAAELAGLDLATAELAADELAAAHILAPARPLDFFHPLIGEAVYVSIGLGARRLAHRRAATIVDRAGAVDRAAAHLLATGPAGDRWVADRLSEAAASAHDRGAPEVAVRYLERALAEPPAETERAQLMLRLGSAEWYTGQPAALTHVEEALAHARNATTIARAAATLANAWAVADRIDAAAAVLRQASSRVAALDPRRAASLEASSVLIALQDDRTVVQAMKVVDRWQAELNDMPDPPVRRLVAIAHAAMGRGQPGVAAPLIKRVLAAQPHPPPVDVTAPVLVTLIGLEDWDTFDRVSAGALAGARRRSAVPGVALVASFTAWGLVHRGDLADAEAQALWALEHTTGIFALYAAAHLADVLIERDELDTADSGLERTPLPPNPHSMLAVPYLMARGRLRTAQGRHAEARRDFLHAGERSKPLGSVIGWHNWRSQAALAHASLGSAREARALARAEVEIARAAGLPRALGVALGACGLVEGGDAGLALLAESVSVLETSRARVELARALAGYGAALRRDGQRTLAREFLERALDLAHYCGARRIAARARHELVAAGAKPRREAITGRDALTAGELRVARLAMEGRTNREIAQSLFITTKTASAHLSRVYRKLGVSRRSELATALDSAIS
jgi:DNA-binding CsgD family transcriptional regulator